MAPLLHLQGIRLTFGGTPLLTGADLVVGQGERLCLVGRNGSGKSTLLKVAAGLVEPDSGTRFIQPRTTIRYLQQEPDFAGFTSTGAFVEAGLAPGNDPNRARYLLRELGLSGTEETSRLSGGEARRAALARVLAPDPDILLLDEPTNHLDLPAIEWLEAELASLRGAIILISHDRRFLSSLSRKTLWLDRGETRLFERGFAEFEAWRDEAIDREERDQHKLDRKILRELDWVRYGVSGRRKRNQKRMADLGELRRKRKEQRGAVGNVKLSMNDAVESSTRVIEARAISKAFDGLTVVREFSTRILRRDRIGIVGANGAGKTTLLRMLIGGLAPDSGEVVLGANLSIAALDQNRASLDPDMRLSEVLTGGGGDTVKIGGQARHVASYMKDFLFIPEQARTPVRVLSGGERGRLLLAKALATPSNLLVLDEPTNDLDLETLDLLQ
jgi:ATP-binding cassette subfamily F protein uup